MKVFNDFILRGLFVDTTLIISQFGSQVGFAMSSHTTNELGEMIHYSKLVIILNLSPGCAAGQCRK